MLERQIAEGDNKVRDHDHITGKGGGSAHRGCNINLKLTKNIPVIFHNLIGYDSHLIMQETGKFDAKCYTKWTRKVHGF